MDKLENRLNREATTGGGGNRSNRKHEKEEMATWKMGLLVCGAYAILILVVALLF